jgi:hypothetical protein
VKVGAARAVVFPEDAVSTIELPPGLHEVTGAFAWDSPPESLEVPPATGLLTLVVRGVKVASPNRDESGAVWLSKTSAAETDEKLDVVVHRKVDDGVPLLLTTRIAWLKWGFGAFITGGAWQKPPAPLPPLPPVHQAYGPSGVPNPPGAWGPQGAAPPPPPSPGGSNDEPPR